VSIRTIPVSLAAANDLPDKELQRIFAEASSLAEEKRKVAEADDALLQWLVKQARERGLKAVAELLDYDAANLAKVIKEKRRLSGDLQKRIREQMKVEGRDSYPLPHALARTLWAISQTHSTLEPINNISGR
jgi:hypothetical protein